MHILIVNDDGPPSNQSSPYVHSLVRTLQDAGHIVSVVLPHQQRSWIGKAHMIGQTVKPTYFRPGTLHKDDGTTHSRPSGPSKGQEEWVLVDGTPASCVQIGLYHYFKDRGPIDLVLSGPNYGRNSTAVFALSSGTLGGALEAAICKKRAIAISYAFDSRNHDPFIIAGASRQAVKLVEYLYKNWGKDVDLYSVNVPLVENVESRKVMWTNMLQNYWGPTSCFEEAEDEDGDPQEEEHKIREGDGAMEDTTAKPIGTNHTHKHFKWAPKFVDVHKSVAASSPGNDGWAVQEGYTSVTPLKANFMHAASGAEGELMLPLPNHFMSSTPRAPITAVIEYEDQYVQPLILSALESRLPPGSYKVVSSTNIDITAGNLCLQISSYESLPFEAILAHSTTCLANSYIIRKALIRKHYLSNTIHNWTTKNPSSVLARQVKSSCSFELDYAEFLDDALVDAWELQASFQKNAGKMPEAREWWILKPGMSDRGQGIRLFSSEEELKCVFEEWEAERPESDDDNSDTGRAKEGDDQGVDYIMTSQLRHFVAQPYIHPPVLLSDNPCKFHIRTYVVAVGSLKIFVYRPMLALFAATPYVAPWATTSDDISLLSAHLTNTCLQDGTREGSVQAFWSLPSTHASLPAEWKESVFKQICEITGEIFEAAAKGMMVHFQTLPNAFEVFGLDFLVDADGLVWLLEVNAFPDFKQTGDEMKDLVAGLWEGVVDVAVTPFFMLESERQRDDTTMMLVKNLDLGRR